MSRRRRRPATQLVRMAAGTRTGQEGTAAAARWSQAESVQSLDREVSSAWDHLFVWR